LRFPYLFASAAALALAACSNGPADNTGSAASQPSIQLSDKDLEKQVLAALQDAPKHGLTKDLFLKGELPSGQAQRRDTLLRIANAYASALAMGKVDPTKIRDVYTVPRPKVDVSAGLVQALQKKQYREWANSLAPQTDEYRALSDAFVKLVQRSPDLPDGDIPAGKTIKRGAADPRIPAIVRNLKELGYLPPELKSGDRYTPAIAQAVARFQSDSGQKPDGVLGPDTVKALNSSPRDRARSLAVAMERLRWLSRNPPATRIDVNTGGSYLDYYRDGQHVDRRKVINGQPGWETPQLGAPIFQLVANPTWTVPDSIVAEELADKGSGWLASNNFTQKNGKWVQASGPKNSLGIVKFDMKDDEAIYLHDTPAKSLFALDDRHRSHGCIRVENALQFAHMLARADGVDAKFSEAMASGKETFVDLNHDIPVRLMYHTAWLGDDGRIHFAQDVYGWDNDVAEALGYAKVERAGVRKPAADVGP
jgi:murein L,D-transpeptidase YcbB/YkuD